jgi:hypothetical protein
LSVALLAVVLGVSGCALPMWNTDRPAAIENGPAPGQCLVELKPAGGGTSKFGQLDLPPDANVSYVLKETKANRKYPRVTIDLYRKLPNGQIHKMPVQYDLGSKQVDPLHDYAVLPGDRLVVSEDTTSGIEDLMKDKLPLGRVFGS